MKVVLAGGSGQVGTILARAFDKDEVDVVVLSRQPKRAPWRTVAWDGHSIGPWKAELDGADVAINLAGRSVNCRYTPSNRREIMDSRILSTRALGIAIAKAAHPPRVWLQAGTATIYAHRFDDANDESSGVIGGTEPGAPETWRFSIDVAKKWEQAFDESDTPRTRKVLMRSAMVLSPDRGGVFDTLLGLARRGLGGRAGNGRQYMSWIHGDDFVRSVKFLIGHEKIAGAINIASPNPLPNDEFMKLLRKAWGTGFGLPSPAWLLEIGAIFLKTETELILKSRRVTPGRLLKAGFKFTHPDWAEAARDLCRSWRAQAR